MGRPRKNNSVFISLLRPLFTIVVLSAFVLGISFFVKAVANSDSVRLLSALSPVLNKFNIDEDQLEAVAGAFISRVAQTGVTQEDSTAPAETSDVKTDSKTSTTAGDRTNNPALSFKVVILSDSHDNNENLTKALTLAREQNPLMLFYLGDFTNYGEVGPLQTAKSVMDSIDLDYLALPGDHDLYKSVGPQNFIDVFGANHFSKTINGAKFVGLDNSANYTVINSEIMNWFRAELKDADFVLLSQPLYHPNLNVVMGVVQGQTNVSVKAQAEEILKLIRESNAKAIVAGDQHMSSQNNDPVKSGLKHIVVGALTDDRNLQTPRFSVLSYYADNSYQVEDVLLK